MKKINGLPHNIVQSFFSTMVYWSPGYMADWLFFAAKRIQASEIEMDIMTSSLKPAKLNIRPLKYHLWTSKKEIERQLQINNLPIDFIVEAKMNVLIPDFSSRLLKVTPTMIDKEGKIYSCDPVFVNSTEKEFNPFLNGFQLFLLSFLKNLRDLPLK